MDIPSSLQRFTSRLLAALHLSTSQLAAPATPSQAGSASASDTGTRLTSVSQALGSMSGSGPGSADLVALSSVPAGSFVPGSGSLTFNCPKCKKQWPLSDSVAKGSQLWCMKDSTSYNGLQARWAKNPKLRLWTMQVIESAAAAPPHTHTHTTHHRHM